MFLLGIWAASVAIDFTRRESRWRRKLKSSCGVLFVERASMWSRCRVTDDSESDPDSDSDPRNESESDSDSGWKESGVDEGRE